MGWCSSAGGGAGRGCESSLETLPSENESESESLPRRGEVFGFLKDYRHLRKVNRTLLKYPIGTFFFFLNNLIDCSSVDCGGISQLRFVEKKKKKGQQYSITVFDFMAKSLLLHGKA